MVRKKLVGDFEIGQTIGEGAFSKVCVGKNRVSGERVAAKVIDVQALVEKGCHDILDMSRREAATMKKLSHSNIVGYKAALFAKNEGKLYIILEFCSGGELFQTVEDGHPLSEERARGYFQDIVEGLSYVHNLGIAHRDLKLENVLLDDKGNAKICDFGFAKTQEDGSLLFTPCGSRLYAAPEVVDH
eukprot:EC852234.1.p2 GENE.EC852234.1~~EC852234.1.p2  ORF type:complete len:187 (+),score=68.06 EC852234.1:93-653(+)